VSLKNELMTCPKVSKMDSTCQRQMDDKCPRWMSAKCDLEFFLSGVSKCCVWKSPKENRRSYATVSLFGSFLMLCLDIPKGKSLKKCDGLGVWDFFTKMTLTFWRRSREVDCVTLMIKPCTSYRILIMRESFI
jgi:hypothetical protein